MSRGFKVRRYSYDRYKKNKRKKIVTLVTLVLVAGALAVGWFAYEPIYNYLMNIKSEKPDSSVSESVSVSPEDSSSEAVPEPVSDALPDRFAYVPASALTGGADIDSYFAALKADGIDGVMLELKDSSGVVQYQSALENVTANQSSADSPYDLTAVIASAEKAGLTAMGRVWAFRDPLSARTMYSSAVKYNYSDVNWIDNSLSLGGKAWLNPNDTAARQYVLSIVEEAAGLGLRHIALAGVQFPDGYSLNLATYGEKGVTVDKSAVLASFVTEARGRAENNGASLWCTVDAASLVGSVTNRLGGDPMRVVDSSERIILDVAPEQFGTGVSVGDFVLTSPILDPYGTVKTTLEASGLDPEATRIIALVQAYTSQTVEQGNREYTSEDVEAQITAAAEYGIVSTLMYNPEGLY